MAGAGSGEMPSKLRVLGDMPDLGEMRLDSLNVALNVAPRHGHPTDALLRSASQLYRMESGTEDSGALLEFYGT